jgi:hypothetical protein
LCIGWIVDAEHHITDASDGNFSYGIDDDERIRKSDGVVVR